MHLIEDPFFNFDCIHLKHFNSELYKQLICYPIEVMEAFDTGVKEFYFTKFPDDDMNIRVRPYNLQLRQDHQHEVPQPNRYRSADHHDWHDHQTVQSDSGDGGGLLQVLGLPGQLHCQVGAWSHLGADRLSNM